LALTAGQGLKLLNKGAIDGLHRASGSQAKRLGRPARGGGTQGFNYQLRHALT
jgi:hypothetical protein